jgi:hypothetical protein
MFYKILFSILIILILLIIPLLDNFLYLKDDIPENIDVLFTFSGDPERIRYSNDIFIKYNTDFWLLSFSNEISLNSIFDNNDFSNNISIVDTCKNTYSEIISLNQYLMNKFKSDQQPVRIVLVSSYFHLKRIKLLVNRLIKTQNYYFYYIPVPYDRYQNKFNKNYWFIDKHYRNSIIKETIKYIYYYFIS